MDFVHVQLPLLLTIFATSHMLIYGLRSKGVPKRIGHAIVAISYDRSLIKALKGCVGATATLCWIILTTTS